MAFHPVDRSPAFGSLTPAATKRISARISLHNGVARVNFRMSRDCGSHLDIGIGDYILPLIGSDEDFGAFAIQRANPSNGYKLGAYNNSRMLTFNMVAHRFMPIPERTTVHFRCEFEVGPHRIIARPAVIDTPNSRLRVTTRAPLTFA